MIKEFDRYVSAYDLNNPNIKLKYDHSYRVMELNEMYATKLGFSVEGILLAKQIGLLHDIGRFEQLRVYNSYDDKTIDHADYGIKLLFDDQIIKKFIPNRNNDSIIKFAIGNHNKFKLRYSTDDLSNEQAELIRDTDKVDILYNLASLNEIDITTTNEPLNEKLLTDFRRNELVHYKYVHTYNEELAIYFGYAFDINNDVCLHEVRKYLDKFYLRLEHKEIFEEIYNIVQKYISERID